MILLEKLFLAQLCMTLKKGSIENFEEKLTFQKIKGNILKKNFCLEKNLRVSFLPL